MAGNQTAISKQFRIQYRRLWTGTWTDDVGTVAINPWTRSCGNRTGGFTLISRTTAYRNREADATACPLDAGYFVRIVERPRRQGDGGNRTDRIHMTGWVRDKTVTPMGASNGAAGSATLGSRIDRVEWNCLGLSGLLAQIDLGRYWCGLGDNVEHSIGMLGIPTFGADRRPDRDHRLAGNVLYGRRGADKWTLFKLLEALLQWHLGQAGGAGSWRYPHWPEFRLSGLTDALDWPVEDVHLTGKLSDAITAIANPRRGLTWRIDEPNDLSVAYKGHVNLRIMSTLQEPITVTLPGGAGTKVLPASTSLVHLSATEPHTRLQFGSSTVPRRLTYRGRRRVAIVNLRWSRDSGGVENGALARTWLAADDGQAGDPQPKYGRVFRSFTLRPGWTGGVLGTAAGSLAGTPEVAGSTGSPNPIHGAGGLTGTLTAGGSFPDLAAKILDQIPMPASATNAAKAIVPISDWLSGTTGVVLDDAAEPLRPQVFVHHRAGAGSWQKLNVSVSVTDQRTVQIGSGPKDAAFIAGSLSAVTDDLVVLLAVESPYALAVSHEPVIDPDGRQIGADVQRTADWCEAISILGGTVLGLDASGAPIAAPSLLSVRDDTGSLRSILMLARPYGERSADATWEDRLNVSNSPEAGGLVVNCARLTESTTVYESIGYIVTAVTCHPSMGTVATIEAAEVDLESIQ